MTVADETTIEVADIEVVDIKTDIKVDTKADIETDIMKIDTRYIMIHE